MIESVMVSGWHMHYTQSRMIRNVHTMTSTSGGQRGFQTTDHWRPLLSPWASAHRGKWGQLIPLRTFLVIRRGPVAL